jgi:hypothetical protein|nr:MAG TPA: hypothetical protein [Caudoviricetes sp.]
MNNKKEVVKNNHFIPSPFPAVTAYENEFVKVWNNNTAEAVAEVLKYMAKATAFAIKETKETKK